MELRNAVIIEPGELEELFEAACRLRVVRHVPIDVAQLLVSDHLVRESLLLLAFVLELGENFLGHRQVLEVHGYLTERFERPIETEEGLLLLLFD